jgi:uncharacterized membrane protein required for colicin V production
MTIGTTDIFLLVIIVSTLVVGFFWGALRSLLLLAGWVLAFLAGAHLKTELGAYLAREWGQFSAQYNDMAAFGIIYVGLLIAAPVVIFMSTRGNQRVTRYQVLDDLVGAAFATFVAIIGIGGVMVVLATFYGTGPNVVETAGGPQWTANLYQSLLQSSIGENIYEHVMPIIGTILGPFLPEDVREAFV